MHQTHDLSPGLLRQRRNLTLTSGALLFVSFSEAKIHSFQILGISASFGHPEAIISGLTLITIYFLYRYWLYLVQESGGSIKSEFFRRLNIYSDKKLHKIRDNQFPSGRGLEIFEGLGVRKSDLFSWSIMVGVEKSAGGGVKHDYLKVSLKEVWKEALLAGLGAVLARSYFTDYIFPFLLSFTALLLTFSDRWS